MSEPTAHSNYRALLGGLGAALLGAATYATWMSDAPLPSAPALFAVGALLVAGAILLGNPDARPLRVGDAGVGVERGGEVQRIAWHQVERVALEGDRVIVAGDKVELAAPLANQEPAAAWILKEALARVPSVVAVPAERASSLARSTSEHDGEVVVLETQQVAGRKCRASGEIIAFESDATVCPRCGEVYARRHAPTACLTCKATL